MNRSLGNLLRCLVGEHVHSWESVLPIAEFAYNGSVNRSIGMSPFEAVTGYKPRMPVDLIPMSSIHCPSESVDAFIHHIHALHNEIRRRINKQNEYYKSSADSYQTKQKII